MRVDGFGNLIWVFGYIGLVGLTSVTATGVFRSQSSRLEQLNRKLLDSSQRESALAARMADQVQELSIFGSVVDYSIVGVSIADMRRPDQPLIYVNNAFTTITGYSWDLAVGYNPRFLQGPDSDPKEVKRIRDAIDAGLPYSGEIVNYRLDGSRFRNRLMLYPVGMPKDPAASGMAIKPDFYVANLIDVSSLQGQSAAVDDRLATLASHLKSAQAALDGAIGWRETMNARLAQGAGTINQDDEQDDQSLLPAEREAQHRLLEALVAIQAWIAERRTSL